MKLHVVLSSFTALTLLSMAPPASAQFCEVEELKSMVRAMQKTIAEQNAPVGESDGARHLAAIGSVRARRQRLCPRSDWYDAR